MLNRRTLLSGAAFGAVGGLAARSALAAPSIPSGALPPARDWRDPASVSYPDPAIEVFDPRFKRVGNAEIERLWTGARWAEGPVWFGDGHYLVFSDIPNNRLMKWDELTGHTTVFRQPSNFTNGNTRDRQGRLLSCEQLGRRVSRTEHDGHVVTVIDSYNGKKLNSPNGVIVKSDDSIWFTDPKYGLGGDYEGLKSESELPATVYRLDPKSGKVTIVASDFDEPNGLCFSPDEKKLYICDTGITDGAGKQTLIRVFDVTDDGRLTNEKLFHDFADTKSGFVDDMRMDKDGNLWCATGWAGPLFNGVYVYAPDGTLIGRIILPEVCANLCFGGREHNRLFMTASTSLYSVYVGTRGTEI